MAEERFVTFKDNQGIEHTYLIVDIQSVGVGDSTSYVRAFNFPMTIPKNEAIRVRSVWMKS